MRQTLFRIPLDGAWSLGPLGAVPGFGFGIVLAAWTLFAAWWLYRQRRELALKAEFIPPVVVWCIFAWVIVMVPEWAQGQFNAVIAEETRAIQRDEKLTSAYVIRGRAWQSKREYQKAIEDYETAIRLRPDLGAAYIRLAWLLATCPDETVRNGAKAVEYAAKARKTMGLGQAEYFDTFAAAYAETEQFGKAVQWAKKAAVLARDSTHDNPRARLSDIRKRLSAYQSGVPFRDNTAGKSLPVYGYGFMLIVGLYMAIRTARGRAIQAGFNPEEIWDITIWVFFSGIVGARLFYITQYRERVFAGCETRGDYIWAAVNLPDGGLVLYGGVLLGIVTFVTYCRVKKLNPLSLADVMMPSIFVGLAFGRLGCFMNGCCYGDRCDLPWSVSFPAGSVPDMALVLRGSVAPDDTVAVQLHPAQIYSSINALLLACLTHTYFRYRRRDGAVLAVGLLSYPVTRFIIEFLRGDELGKFNTPLTIAQWVSIGMFLAGLLYLYWLIRRCSTEKGTGPICRNGPKGVSHTLDLSPFPRQKVLSSVKPFNSPCAALAFHLRRDVIPIRAVSR